MAKKQGVSSKTHTKQQLDDYANQHNPNNKAYKAKVNNQKQISKRICKSDILRLGIRLWWKGSNTRTGKRERTV